MWIFTLPLSILASSCCNRKDTCVFGVYKAAARREVEHHMRLLIAQLLTAVRTSFPLSLFVKQRKLIAGLPNSIQLRSFGFKPFHSRSSV